MGYMARTLTVRVDEERLAALDKVAAGLDRDRSYVVTEAIDSYLASHAWQVAYIEEAVRDAEAGKFASDAEVAETFKHLRGSRKKKAV
jgi:predicted transcriptional regulator